VGQAVFCVLGILQPVKCTDACPQAHRTWWIWCPGAQDCLWCNTDKACLDYPVTNVLPPASLCKLSSARWGVCWVNFEALIITMSVVGGAFLLGIAICCCCCCRRKRSRKPDRSEEKAIREREERRIRQEERRAEMKTRHDEIRKKYGLFKEENPYARFENN
uniref:PTTG1 interacting protein n=1 Tax=Cebus imitator TaxID=2715852 RepID=A0A2K5RBX5_CEBIM